MDLKIPISKRQVVIIHIHIWHHQAMRICRKLIMNYYIKLLILMLTMIIIRYHHIIIIS